MLGGKKKLKEKLIVKESLRADDEVSNLNIFIFQEYIFINPQKKLAQQIEIQVILNANNNNKVIIIIDKKSTIDYLCVKIAEDLEKFQEYASLEGSKAVNLRKWSDKGMIKIPNTGEIKDYINDGDLIYCDLYTNQYWVKTIIKLNSFNLKLTITLDIKFRLETLIEKIKFLLLKLGINFWMDYNKGMNDFSHYIFKSIHFKSFKGKSNIEFYINENAKLEDINKSKFLFYFNIFIQ